MKESELTDMVVFRENTEDIYAGIEWAAGTPEVHRVINFLQYEMGVTAIRFPAVPASASNRCPRKARSVWSARPYATPSTMTACQ